MHLTLIKPNIGRREHSLYVDEGRMEPLPLGILAGLTPSDVDISLYDDRMEEIPYDERTDLVAITVETYTARRSYEIAAEYRARGVPVIMGGMHATLIPEEVSLHADSIFIGDAETAWEQVISDARHGKLMPIYKGPPGIAQINGTLPRRDLYKGKGYLPMGLMQFTRGCHFPCKFCAVAQYFDRKHYVRSIDETVREIHDSGKKFFFFIDDNIVANRKAIQDLCKELIPLNIHWISQASMDVVHDSKTMELMQAAGNWGNVVGFESITQASLKETKKSPNLARFSLYENEVAILKKYNMQTWASFSLGYDHDTQESIAKTVDFALESKFAFGAFNILMPYPNTPLYNKLKEERRLLYDDKWWLHPEYRFNEAAYKPTLMSANELTDACHAARVKFNKLSSLVHRFSDLGTNMRTLSRAITFWRYTLLFRKEVYKKHRMRFGLK